MYTFFKVKIVSFLNRFKMLKNGTYQTSMNMRIVRLDYRICTTCTCRSNNIHASVTMVYLAPPNSQFPKKNFALQISFKIHLSVKTKIMSSCLVTHLVQVSIHLGL